MRRLASEMPTSPERGHLAGGSRLEQVVDEVFAGLAADAITGDGLAVWVGSGTALGGRAGSVGPTLYGGTAGLALALVTYATHRSQDWALDLARLASRHAVEQAPTVPPAHRFGFYGGWAGIVYSVTAVATQASDLELQASARTLMQELADTAPSGEFDLVSGQGELWRPWRWWRRSWASRRSRWQPGPHRAWTRRPRAPATAARPGDPLASAGNFHSPGSRTAQPVSPGRYWSWPPSPPT